MQVQWTFEGCAGTTKEKCRAYWEKKQKRLERLLAGISYGSKKTPADCLPSGGTDRKV